jgi:hypothetical protein
MRHHRGQGDVLKQVALLQRVDIVIKHGRRVNELRPGLLDRASGPL